MDVNKLINDIEKQNDTIKKLINDIEKQNDTIKKKYSEITKLKYKIELISDYFPIHPNIGLINVHVKTKLFPLLVQYFRTMYELFEPFTNEYGLRFALRPNNNDLLIDNKLFLNFFESFWNKLMNNSSFKNTYTDYRDRWDSKDPEIVKYVNKFGESHIFYSAMLNHMTFVIECFFLTITDGMNKDYLDMFKKIVIGILADDVDKIGHSTAFDGKIITYIYYGDLDIENSLCSTGMKFNKKFKFGLYALFSYEAEYLFFTLADLTERNCKFYSKDDDELYEYKPVAFLISPDYDNHMNCIARRQDSWYKYYYQSKESTQLYTEEIDINDYSDEDQRILWVMFKRGKIIE